MHGQLDFVHDSEQLSPPLVIRTGYIHKSILMIASLVELVLSTGFQLTPHPLAQVLVLVNLSGQYVDNGVPIVI